MGDEQESRLGIDEEAAVAKKPAGGRKPRATTARADIAGDDYSDEREHDRDTLDDMDLSDDERLEAFRDSMRQSVLPDLPKMPGFHLCWLTTTNARDSIQNRVRMGYQLVRADMLRGWEGITVQAGEFAGVIGVNEMVAARLPDRLYKLFMKETHHNAPLAEEEKLRARTKAISAQAEAMGARVLEDAGQAEEFENLRARTPSFSD